MSTDGTTVFPLRGQAGPVKVWTRGERATIVSAKDRVVQALAESGFRVDRVAFPFAMHHRIVVRTVRHGFDGRGHLRTGEVSDLLEEWARGNGGAEIYAWQAVALAADALAERQGRVLPPEVDDAVERLLVDRGLGFVRSVRRAVGAGRLPSFVPAPYAGSIPSEAISP